MRGFVAKRKKNKTKSKQGKLGLERLRRAAIVTSSRWSFIAGQVGDGGLLVRIAEIVLRWVSRAALLLLLLAIAWRRHFGSRDPPPFRVGQPSISQSALKYANPHRNVSWRRTTTKSHRHVHSTSSITMPSSRLSNKIWFYFLTRFPCCFGLCVALFGELFTTQSRSRECEKKNEIRVITSPWIVRRKVGVVTSAGCRVHGAIRKYDKS